MLPGKGSEKSEFSTWHTDYNGPSPIVDIFFSNERCSYFFFLGGGGSEPVRLEEKSALNFFLDCARGRAQQR